MLFPFLTILYLKWGINVEEKIQPLLQKFGNSSDFILRTMQIHGHQTLLLFNEVLCSSDSIHRFVLERVDDAIDQKLKSTSLFSFFLNSFPGHNVKPMQTEEEMITSLMNGYCIFFLDTGEAIGVEARAILDRGIPEASNEQAIQGPKDAFVELYNKNLGLIRRRIKSPSLWVKDFVVGTKTKTKIGLLYMADIVDFDFVTKIAKKIENIDIDGIIDSGYLKEFLSPKDAKLFPVILLTERPDLVSMSLLEGKVAIIVDNSPYVLILPCFFVDFFHTSDDYYQKDIHVSFIRIIRFLSFFIAIFIPAFYIASTTHNQDLLSLDLLINFTAQRESVPFPALIEALLMSITFEILRESDARIPSSMGTAVSILGGLVLGDAAVSAGIVSPIMIIVIAISAISGLLFASQEMISAIRVWRFLLLFLATILGMYGIFLGGIFLLSKLCSIDSFGKPYLSPLAPFLQSEQEDAIIKWQKKGIKRRNPLLSRKNRIRGKIQ